MRITAGMIGLTHPHSAGHLRTLDALEEIAGVVLYAIFGVILLRTDRPRAALGRVAQSV